MKSIATGIVMVFFAVLAQGFVKAQDVTPEEQQAKTLGKKGFDFMVNGTYDSALICLSESAEIFKALSHDVGYIHMSSYYVWVLMASGEIQKALKDGKELEEFSLEKIGDKHPATANVFNTMGAIAEADHRFEECINYHKKALEVYQKAFGDEHPNVGSSYGNIGTAYYRMGRYNKAVPFFEKCLEVMVPVTGLVHPEIAGAYSNLGMAYMKTGEFENALLFTQKGLDIRRKMYGEEHEHTAASLLNLSVIYSLQESPKEKAVLMKAYRIYNDVIGNKSEDLINIQHKLGTYYKENEEYDSADFYLREAIKTSEVVFGKNHPQSLYSRLSLIKLKAKTSEELDFDLEKEMKIILKEASKTSDPRVFNSEYSYMASELAGYYYRKGLYDSSLVYVQKSLVSGHKEFVSSNLEDNPDTEDSDLNVNTADLMNMKADLFLKLNRLEASLKTFYKSDSLWRVLFTKLDNENDRLELMKVAADSYVNAAYTHFLCKKLPFPDFEK